METSPSKQVLLKKTYLLKQVFYEIFVSQSSSVPEQVFYKNFRTQASFLRKLHCTYKVSMKTYLSKKVQYENFFAHKKFTMKTSLPNQDF